MNKTLVILGNGFDLDLGWKTSYNDFYLSKKQRFNEFNGMPYIQEMISEGHWNNLEGYLRNCVVNATNDTIETVNYFWITCRNLIGEYLNKNTSVIYNTNYESCAYEFLKSLSSSNIISFNYTNPFKILGLGDKINILNLHGSLEEIISGAEIKLGVDSFVLSENVLAKNELLKYIIKIYENSNVDVFFNELKNSENIIIYGHSLGITDSDYFKPFFKAIIDGKLINKNIYIVTYNDKSLQDIKDNMLSYGIDYSELAFSKNVEINTIFTSKGKDDEAFLNMLSNVSL